MKRLCTILLCIHLFVGHQFITRAFATKDRWDANKSNWSPLMLFSYQSDTSKIDSLLKSGVNINEQIPGGYTALDIAIRNGCTTAVWFLLKHNANPNLADTDGYTPILWASFGDNFEIVRLLLNYKSDPNKGLKNGYTPLMAAASFGTIKIMELLISNDANVDFQRRSDGWTPLRFAEYNGDKDKINLLKKYGAK